VTGRFGEEAVKKFTVDPKKDPGLAKFRTPLGLAQFSTWVLRLTVGIAPIPHEDMQGVSGHDPEMERMLIEMGYSVGEENINARPEVDVPGSPPAP